MGGAYYTTFLHELAHWSEIRLGWDHETHGYAMGELVAEIASCYSVHGIGRSQWRTVGKPRGLPEVVAGSDEKRSLLHFQGIQAGVKSLRLFTFFCETTETQTNRSRLTPRMTTMPLADLRPHSHHPPRRHRGRPAPCLLRGQVATRPRLHTRRGNGLLAMDFFFTALVELQNPTPFWPSFNALAWIINFLILV